MHKGDLNIFPACLGVIRIQLCHRACNIGRVPVKLRHQLLVHVAGILLVIESGNWLHHFDIKYGLWLFQKTVLSSKTMGIHVLCHFLCSL